MAEDDDLLDDLEDGEAGGGGRCDVSSSSLRQQWFGRDRPSRLTARAQELPSGSMLDGGVRGDIFEIGGQHVLELEQQVNLIVIDEFEGRAAFEQCAERTLCHRTAGYAGAAACWLLWKAPLDSLAADGHAPLVTRDFGPVEAGSAERRVRRQRHAMVDGQHAAAADRDAPAILLLGLDVDRRQFSTKDPCVHSTAAVAVAPLECRAHERSCAARRSSRRPYARRPVGSRLYVADVSSWS